MEVRAAESRAVTATPAPTVANRRPSRVNAATRTIGLSREAEMDYQRNDLRRLLYTAAVLFVVMIVLLIILD